MENWKKLANAYKDKIKEFEDLRDSTRDIGKKKVKLNTMMLNENSLEELFPKSNNVYISLYITSSKSDFRDDEAIKSGYDSAFQVMKANQNFKLIPIPGANGIKDVEDLRKEIIKMRDEYEKKKKGLVIRNFYVGSHGNYWNPKFFIGSDSIVKENVSDLSILDWEATNVPIGNVVLMSCHTGGGDDNGESKNFLIEIAKNIRTWGSVLGSASWVGNVFDDTQEIVYPTIFSKYTEEAINEFIEKPGAVCNAGIYREVYYDYIMQDYKVKVINSIKTTSKGEWVYLETNLNQAIRRNENYEKILKNYPKIAKEVKRLTLNISKTKK